MQINVYRNGTVQATFEADLNTVFTQQIMGEHKITAYFFAPAPLDVQLGDYIIVSGDNFYINFVPTVQKVNNFSYHHTITFEAEIYKLYNKIFMDEGAAEFSYFGGPLEFVQLLVDNLNEIEAGWTVGNVDDADGQNLQFSGNDCRTALTNIAQAFKMEYSLSGKAVNLVLQIGNTSTLQFEYGRGKGLYSLTRQNIDSVNVVTRAYGFGGQKNIDYNYRNGAPFGSAQGTKRLIFASKYLEANIALYGIREGSITFDDIFPQRTGGVTAINATDIFQFTDSGLDFDINAQLMEGVTAAVIFKTGALAGYQFDILSYDNTNKIVHFKAFTDSNDYVLPNSLNKPSVGDTYTLVNISMPQTYIDAAETLLQQKTQEYLNQNSVPRVTYALNIDEKFVRDNGVLVKVGDRVTVIDAALGLNAVIRVSQLEFPLANPAAIKATIADTIAYTIQERLISKTVDNAKVIKRVDVTRSEASRINAMRTRQLQNLVFDPDGYFDGTHIKPESIETLMLSVGAKSQDFNLSGVTIQPNAGGNANALTISAGELIHREVDIEGLGYVWEMAPFASTTLSDQVAYYVYAKCSTTQLTGTWETSETPKKVNDEAGYYLLNLGVLYAVANGRRDFAFTNGMTFISGDNVTTGRIKDLSGQNYLDLNDGKMNLGNATSGLDWDVSKPDTLTIRGGLVVNPGGASEPLGVFRGAYDSTATYYKGDTVTYDGSSFKVIAAAPISGITPNDDGVNYSISAARGQTGSGGILRVIYAKNSDADNAPALTLTDANPAGWSQQMPKVDTYWLLATQEGDYIATQSGDQYLTTVDGEYIWASTEILDVNNNFSSWIAPTRISGRNGIPNEYTEYRFQKNGSPSNAPTVDKTNADPAGWTIEMPTIMTAEYLWLIKANKLPNGTLVSAWSDPVRTNGVDGGTVSQGDAGPFMMFRGEYDSTKQYVGNTEHIEAAEYDGLYYVTRTDAGNIPVGTLPTDTSFWNTFSGQFESVATGLLLAQLAYITNLGVRYVQTNDSGQRIVIDGANNNMSFYDTDGTLLVSIDSNIYSRPLWTGGTVQKYSGIKLSKNSDALLTLLTSAGILANGSQMVFNNVARGIYSDPRYNAGTIVGVLQSMNGVPNANNVSAAVVGLDNVNHVAGDGTSWGGYFSSLKVLGKVEMTGINSGGLSIGAKTIIANYALADGDTFITCNNRSSVEGAITITLPATPANNRLLYIKKANTGNVAIDGSGQTFQGYSQNFNPTYALPAGQITMLVWDGSFWQIANL